MLTFHSLRKAISSSATVFNPVRSYTFVVFPSQISRSIRGSLFTLVTCTVSTPTSALFCTPAELFYRPREIVSSERSIQFILNLCSRIYPSVQGYFIYRAPVILVPPARNPSASAAVCSLWWLNNPLHPRQFAPIGDPNFHPPAAQYNSFQINVHWWFSLLAACTLSHFTSRWPSSPPPPSA